MSPSNPPQSAPAPRLASRPGGEAPPRPGQPGRDVRLPPGTPRILHLDVDAFLASVEQALHPRLRNRPIVVGGSPDSRNLVMSSSYEARAFGVRPGMHLSEARRRCPRAIFRDGDAQAANRLREGTTRVLLGFTPRVEVASIDDFFLDLSGATRLYGDACEAAARIRRAVWTRVHLPLTVGIGTSKLIARLAGKLAKPGGVAEILPGCERSFLGSLPVRELPGVGHSIGAKLERFAIRTVGELALVPREILFASFGRDGLTLFDRARAHDPSPVEVTHAIDEDGVLVPRPPRSIRRETTFEPEEGRPVLLVAMLSYLVERAAAHLRKHGLVCGSLEVRVRWVDTRARLEAARANEYGGGSSAAKRRALAAPSDATDALVRHARALFEELPHRRALVKNLGLTLLALRPASGWQGQLFDAPLAGGEADEHDASRADRHRRLDAVVDQLRAKLGFGSIVRGSSTPLEETHPLGPDGFRLRTPSLNQ